MEDKYLRRIDLSNKSRRLPICFCIDTSRSMQLIVEGYDESIDGRGKELFADQRVYRDVAPRPEHVTLMDKLHEGIVNFYNAIIEEDVSCDSCEAAIVTFSDHASLYDGFSSVEDKSAPNFNSEIGNNTNVSPAIRMALDLLAKQTEFYRSNKISRFTPWLVLFTDGLPTDDVSVIKRELMQMQDEGNLFVYTMALSDDPELLSALRGFSRKPPIKCSDPKEIKRFFDFLARSVSIVAEGGTPEDYF